MAVTGLVDIVCDGEGCEERTEQFVNLMESHHLPDGWHSANLFDDDGNEYVHVYCPTHSRAFQARGVKIPADQD